VFRDSDVGWKDNALGIFKDNTAKPKQAGVPVAHSALSMHHIVAQCCQAIANRTGRQ
jgi:hypothetical protein